MSILFYLLVVKTSAIRTGKDVKQFQEEQTFESLEHYFASRLQEDKNTKSDRPISNPEIEIGDFFSGNENSELLKGNHKLSFAGPPRQERQARFGPCLDFGMLL